MKKKSNETIVVLGLITPNAPRTVRLIGERENGVEIAWSRRGRNYSRVWHGPWRRHGEEKFHTGSAPPVALVS